MLKKIVKARRMKMDEIYRYCIVLVLNDNVLVFHCVRLRSIKKEIAQNEASVLRKMEKSLKLKHLSSYQTKRLGRLVYPEINSSRIVLVS